MGWKTSFLARATRLACTLLAGTALAGVTQSARAQSNDPFPFAACPPNAFPYTYWTGTSADDTVTIFCGNYLRVLIGGGYDPKTGVVAGKNQAGSFGLWTAPTNTADVDANLLDYWPEKPPNSTQLRGTHVYVRVDGGKFSGQLSGYDYDLGNMDPTIGGDWIMPPTIVGNHVEARWETSPAYIAYALPAGTTGTGGGNGGTGGGTGGTGGGTGGGTIGVVGSIVQPPRIEIDLKISFVHDLARWEFDVINNDTGATHTVGIGFLEDISPNLNFVVGSAISRNQGATINKEVILTGASVPATWSTLQYDNNLKPKYLHTLLGVLRPTATSNPTLDGPTTPTRMVVGSSEYRIDNYTAAKLSYNSIYYGQPINGNLNGNIGLASPAIREYEEIWNYQPDPNTTLNTSPTSEGVALFWDPQTVAPGQRIPIITYVGANTATHDFGTPLSLSVSGPQALALDSTSGAPANSPNTFTIAAYCTNNTDFQTSGGQALSPVNLSIDLPKGLALATGETRSKQIVSISPGYEGSAQWSVVADGSASGTLTYTVSAAPGNFGSGKIVQRSIVVPASPRIPLKRNSETNGQYQMVTLPFQFGSATPTQILFTGLDPNVAAPDIAYWSPANGHYSSTNSFTPGDAYWVRNRLEVLPNPINTALYPPIPNQAQAQFPTTSTTGSYRKSYGAGWNQIGSPYLYPVNFADVQVFDTQTLQLYTIEQAASPGVNLILPAVYYYDTVNTDPTQWQYVMLSDLGFQMQPYQGYWLYVKKPNLQFLYNGVSIVGAGTKSAKPVGPTAQLGKGISNNWRLRLAASGPSGIDQYNYIGVAPNATDNSDPYKYVKPPMINKQVSLAIVHNNWSDGTLYAQDLRSATPTTKTWDVTVTSGKPNENVTVSWPELNSSVPKNYALSLVDTETRATVDLRGRSAYTVNTGTTATHHLQIVAQPTTATSRVHITSFDVTPPSRVAGRAATSLAISYAVTGEAQTHVLVRDGRGRTVRQLETTTRAAGAPNAGSIVWDLRNEQGIAMPAGVYSFELNAIGADGQRARQTRQVTLTR